MTSMIPSSSVRQTPVLTVPSTQNTAPVLDYRCLYTHDLRRKQKRWQDGVLRFHTFNKRIMVYDTARNYIGDMHWRENEVLQDGDEFELDRGVLIQVGESTGSMEQDLTGLFERKKKAPEVAVQEEVFPQLVAVPTAQTTAAQPSQLRPKTLNSLLGTPKGRIGRAVLPTKSPHELRTESENLCWEHERPAKRQRIEPLLDRRAQRSNAVPQRDSAKFQDPCEAMNRRVVGGAVDQISGGNLAPTVMRNSNSSNVLHSVTLLPPLCGSIIQQDKDDETSALILEPLPTKSSSGGPESAARHKRRSDQNSHVLPRAMKVAKRPEPKLVTGDASTSATTKPIGIASDEDATPTNDPQKQRGKLQMASRKPRKKLMYRDLLPQESHAFGHSFNDAPVLDGSSSNQRASGGSGNSKSGLMTEFHKEEQDWLKARLDRHREKELQRDNEREQFCGDAPEDLFLSQESDDAKSANYRVTKEKGAGKMIDEPSMSGSHRCRTESALSSTRRSPSQGSLQNVIPRPHSSVHSTAVTLAKMDGILFPHPQPRTSDPVQENDTLTEIVHQEPSPPSVPNTPSKLVSKPSSPKDRPNSSPAFQIQAHIPPSKDLPRKDISKRSKSNPAPLSAFAKAVQPKAQASKRRKAVSPPPDSCLLSTEPAPPLAPHNRISARSPKDQRASPLGLQPHPHIRPNESPPPQPSTTLVSPLPDPAPNSPLAISNPTAPDPAPKPKQTRNPTFIKPTAKVPPPNLPDAELVEIPSSPPPTSPPPPSPPPKRKPNALLPAFTKVIPTTKPRLPLKKSASETSTMHQPFTLPVPNAKGKEKVLAEDAGQKNDGNVGLWNKEAWDLFGCGRDGVECTYEEFKRKEGFL